MKNKLKFLLSPFNNKFASGDTDEGTLMLMGVNWLVVAVVIAIIAAIFKLSIYSTRAVNKTTIGNIQTQNQSITANDEYKNK